jgi:hypothetical protein
MMRVPEPNFSHLLSLSGPFGTFEHADHTVARVEHGYCTDDVARVLLVCVRESAPSREVAELARSSMRFLADAQGLNGQFRNRRRESGSWSGPVASEDCWGRAIWALGSAIRFSKDESLVESALVLFRRAVMARSRWPRSMAFATLGVTEFLTVKPEDEGARALLGAAAEVLDRPEVSESWRWPEERLRYANAILPEALMTIGSVLGDDRLVANGLRQLRWLLDKETWRGHLSVVPDGGRGPEADDRRFDQQPIEVAAMSEACIRALELTGDTSWIVGHEMAVQWFVGKNDGGVVMFDAATGGGYDGLTALGANLNEGAESTIALLTTLQHARRFAKASS